MELSEHITYTLEKTKILKQVDRQIDTFGSTNFNFILITPLMDEVNQIRVREGQVIAQKPQIIKPNPSIDLEGFSPDAHEFLDAIKKQLKDVSFLQYGFNIQCNNLVESIVNESLDTVSNKILTEQQAKDNPLTTVIQGVDENWEFCLLHFSMQLCSSSYNVNQFDLKRRGLI